MIKAFPKTTKFYVIIAIITFVLTGCGQGSSTADSNQDTPTPSNSDASLSSLTANITLDQSFQSTLTEYTATVGFLQSVLSVQIVPTNNKASVTLNGNPITNDSEQTISLSEGINNIAFEVTAENGTKETYTISLTRELFTTLEQQAYIKASNIDSGDQFGKALAISGDTLVVGVASEDGDINSTWATPNDNAANAGAVYVFVRNGTTWTQQAYLKASNAEAGDSFGSSVAILGDTLVIGAFGEDGDANSTNLTPNDNLIAAGAVYVFERNGTNWAQQAYLKAPNAGEKDYFGVSVAIDRDTIAVGADLEDGYITSTIDNPNDLSTSAGAVYVFTRTNGIWTHQAYLKASNADEFDYFGEDVDISGDTIVVGARQEDGDINSTSESPNNNGLYTGAAYVFIRDGNSWSQQAYLKASNPDDRDRFGSSVAIDGDTIVIGSPFDNADIDTFDSGAAYVFERNETTWIQKAYLKAHNFDSHDNFGGSVTISGNTIAVGAIYEDGDANSVVDNTNDNETHAGAVYIYTKNGTTWSQMAYRKASNAIAMDEFGGSLAIDRDTLVVGARNEGRDANGNFTLLSAGAVYVTQ